MLSGGSAFKMLDFLPPGCLNRNLTITALDERFSFRKKERNFTQLKQLGFYAKAKYAGSKFIDTRPSAAKALADKRAGESLSGFARRIENLIREWKTLNPAGSILITQGMGSDGHTAGIMPYPENPLFFSKLFENKKRWSVGYNAGKKNRYPKRMTVNTFFLKKIVDESVAYITGKEKAEAFVRLKAKRGTLAQTPARVMLEMKKISIFTDIAV